MVRNVQGTRPTSLKDESPVDVLRVDQLSWQQEARVQR